MGNGRYCDFCKQVKPWSGSYKDTHGRVWCKECFHSPPRGAVKKKQDKREKPKRPVKIVKERIRLPKRDPGTRPSYAQQYYDILKNSPRTFTSEDWKNALSYFSGRCAVCGGTKGHNRQIVPDHWIAVKSPDYPGDIPGNVIPLCNGIGGCNTSKGKKESTKWLVWKFGEEQAKQILARVDEYFIWAITPEDDRDMTKTANMPEGRIHSLPSKVRQQGRKESKRKVKV